MCQAGSERSEGLAGGMAKRSAAMQQPKRRQVQRTWATPSEVTVDVADYLERPRRSSAAAGGGRYTRFRKWTMDNGQLTIPPVGGAHPTTYYRLDRSGNLGIRAG